MNASSVGILGLKMFHENILKTCLRKTSRNNLGCVDVDAEKRRFGVTCLMEGGRLVEKPRTDGLGLR